MEIEKLLAEVNGSDTAEADQEQSTTQDSPAETEEEREEPSQEGDESEEESTDESDDDNTPDAKDVPFHKHPRWKKKQEEIEALKEQVEELKTTSTTKDAPLDAAEEPLPQWVLGLAGGQDTPEARNWYKQYKAANQSDRESIRQEVLSEIKQTQEKEKQELDKWNSWVDDEVVRLQDEGNSFNKNELLKVANEYQPVDAKGNISFDKALEILKLQKAQKAEAAVEKTDKKKEIAASTTSHQKGGSTNDNKAFTPHSLRNQDFYDLA